MSSLVQDLRYALRVLRHSPVFTAVAVLSLALGIGANTAIFHVLDVLVLRSLPVKHSEQLVLFGPATASGLTDAFPNGDFHQLYSWPFLESVRQNARTLTGAAAIESMRADVHARFSSASDAEPVKVRLVTGGYFDLLGVGPAAGRLLSPGEDDKPGAHPVAILSDAFWERRFGRDPHVVGQAVSFNGTVFTVRGVAERGFYGTEVGDVPDLWIPLAMQAQVQPWISKPWDMLTQSLWIIARRS